MDATKWHSGGETPQIGEPVLFKTSAGYWQVITNKHINGSNGTYWLAYGNSLKVVCWAYIADIVPAEILNLTQ